MSVEHSVMKREGEHYFKIYLIVWSWIKKIKWQMLKAAALQSSNFILNYHNKAFTALNNLNLILFLKYLLG